MTEHYSWADFLLVTLEDGRLLTGPEGKLCLQNKSDGDVCFVDATQEVLKAFNLKTPEGKNLEEAEATDGSQNTAKCDEDSRRTKWTDEAIHQLIHLRIEYDNEFKSTTQKNEVVWKRIAQKLKDNGYCITATQCNDKWRYLKARYTRKKDNMGSKGTGEGPVFCPFFDILDEFLQDRHNIKPCGIASSMKGDTIPTNATDDTSLDSNDETDEGRPTPPKKVKRHLTLKNQQNTKALVDIIKEGSTTREINKQQRHQEILEARDRAVHVFSQKIDELINVLKKNDN